MLDDDRRSRLNSADLSDLLDRSATDDIPTGATRVVQIARGVVKSWPPPGGVYPVQMVELEGSDYVGSQVTAIPTPNIFGATWLGSTAIPNPSTVATPTLMLAVLIGGRWVLQ